MAKESSRIARVRVSYELLRQVFDFPDDVQIESVYDLQENGNPGPFFEMLITSEKNEDIPIINEGDEIPLVEAVLTRVYEKTSVSFIKEGLHGT